MDDELTPNQDRSDVARLDAPRAAKVFWGRVARVHQHGDGLRYYDKKTGKWTEQHRDADELSRLVAQLPGVKVVAPPDQPVRHPQMLTTPKGEPSGAPHRVVGRILSARLDGDFAVAEILIDDPETLKAIEDEGFRELSLGYWSRLDKEGFQRSTRVDHLAVVMHARCGESCEMRVDEAAEGDDLEPHVDVTAQGVGCGCPSKTGTDQSSACQCKAHAVSLAEKDTPLMDELQKQLQAALAEISALKAQKDAAETRATQAEKDRDTARLSAHDAKKDLEAAQARVDAAEKERDTAKEQASKDAADEFQAQVDARVELLTEVQPLGLKDEKDEPLNLKTLDERAIKIAVIKHIDGADADIGEKDSLDLVRGMYRSAMKRSASASTSRQNVRQAVQSMRDSAPKRSVKKQAHADESAALKKMHEDMTSRARKGR